MRFNLRLWIIFGCIIFVPFACGKKDSSSDSKDKASQDGDDEDDDEDDDGSAAQTETLDFSVGAESIGSLPTYSGAQLEAAGDASTAALQVDTLGIDLTFSLAGEAVTDNLTASFFRLECHWAEPSKIEDNSCPKNISDKLVGLTEDELYNTGFKLTSFTLIGVIEHAALYLGNHYRFGSSLSGSGTHATSFSYESTTGQNEATDSSGDPDKFSLKIADFYDHYVAPSGSQTGGDLYHASTGDGRFGITHVSKHSGFSGGGNTSIAHSLLEVYMTTNEAGDAPKILANNSASVNDYDSNDFSLRNVLLLNFQTNKFITKYGSGDTGNGMNSLVAIGTGGMDMETGVLLDGYYAVASLSGSEPEYKRCVNNATQTVVDDSNCTEELTLWAGSFDVATYLGLTDQEATDLAEYVSMLANGDYMTADQVPADAADDTKNMPDAIVVVEEDSGD